MSSNKEQTRLFSPDFDNKEPIISAAGTKVTFDFVNSGTDTDTTYYYGLGGSGALSFVLRPSATALVTHINNKELSNPITISTAGWVEKFLEVQSLVIETTASSTSLKLFARGGR